MVVMLLLTGPANSDTPKTYIFAWEDWEPYQYKDANGRLTGVEIELLNAILTRMGISYKWQETPWKRALKDIKEGFLDAALSAAITPERKKWANFSDPYMTGGASLFVLKGTSRDFPLDTLRDIIDTDFRLGVTRGYYYGDSYDRLIKNPDFKRHVEAVKLNDANYRKLIKGRIHGFLADPISAVAGLKSLGLLDQVEQHPMEVFSSDSHIIFNKKSVPPEFIDQFNLTLNEMKADGSYDIIINRWLQ